MNMKVEKIQAKTLVRTSNRSPHHIHMNLYQGCYHNCAYCNGTSDNYHMHDDFGVTIKAKINAPELFEEYLVKKGLVPFNRNGTTTLDEFIESKNNSLTKYQTPKFLLSLFGNVCDIYQPAEEELQLTRQLLLIAYDYGIPVRLLTKSDLALRDLDIIKKIHETSFARVAFTVTLMNENDQKNIEPNASSTFSRIQAIKEFRNASIPSGAYITPVIPFIGDTEENLENIFAELECLESDILKMSDSQLQKLPISQAVIPTIREILVEGKSTYLEDKGDFGELLYSK